MMQYYRISQKKTGIARVLITILWPSTLPQHHDHHVLQERVMNINHQFMNINIQIWILIIYLTPDKFLASASLLKGELHEKWNSVLVFKLYLFVLRCIHNTWTRTTCGLSRWQTTLVKVGFDCWLPSCFRFWVQFPFYVIAETKVHIVHVHRVPMEREHKTSEFFFSKSADSDGNPSNGRRESTSWYVYNKEHHPAHIFSVY